MSLKLYIVMAIALDQIHYLYRQVVSYISGGCEQVVVNKGIIYLAKIGEAGLPLNQWKMVPTGLLAQADLDYALVE